MESLVNVKTEIDLQPKIKTEKKSSKKNIVILILLVLLFSFTAFDYVNINNKIDYRTTNVNNKIDSLDTFIIEKNYILDKNIEKQKEFISLKDISKR
jgi:hypothetical protein